jgi:hypothetical protein
VKNDPEEVREHAAAAETIASNLCAASRQCWADVALGCDGRSLPVTAVA